MKNIKIVFFALVGLLIAFSCEDDKTKEKINLGDPEPAVVVTPSEGSSFELLLADGTNDFAEIIWSEADFGSQVPRNYSLQVDKEGNNFEDALELTNTSDLTYTTKIADLNLALYDFGLEAGSFNSMQLRVVTSVNSTSVDTLLASNPVNFSIKPFDYNKPTISAPSNGGTFILVRDTSGLVEWETFNWATVNYGSPYSVTYSLQFDVVDSNFVNPTELFKGSVGTYIPKVKELNTALLLRGVTAGTPTGIEFRILASIGGVSGKVFSDITTLTVTPYEDKVSAETPVIYMLGGATTQGWTNNDNNIVAYYQPTSEGDSTFTAVDFLQPNGTGGSDGFIKFVRYKGIWAPQWGSDGAGTWESGNLVYRPTEAVADPSPIPAPDVAGDYMVSVDIVNLTYEITKVAETLHLIGDATSVDWNNANAIPMTKDAPGKFSIITTLESTATEGFKFLVNQGAWEPMYGQDGNGTWEAGYMKYRPVGAPDVKSIPPPPATGEYLIEVDFAANTYKLTLQE